MVQTAQTLEQQTLTPWLAKPGAGHAAQFYLDGLRFGAYALEYIHAGLTRRETCLVIATPEILIAVQKGLRRRGIDISTALTEGRYVTYDAEELLSEFMNDRELDTRLFSKFAASLSRHVVAAQRPARVFCEMAALLRQQKNPLALMQLERGLDELSREYRFSLYCAYPVLDERSEFSEIHKAIQDVHDRVFCC